MQARPAPEPRYKRLATRAPYALRLHTAAARNGSTGAVAASSPADSADGFVAEYELAGIKLDSLARRQLRAWYAGELQRTSPGAPAAGAYGLAAGTPAVDGAAASRELPPLAQRRPGTPRLTVLWDVESLKPFTQQQQAAPTEGAGPDNPDQVQQRARAGPSSGGRAAPSRLAAAGLLGGAASPDLIRALDQLCRTLSQYGTVHAVHLFLRESTLGKAPVLRRQVGQLRTWVAGPPQPEQEQAGPEAPEGGRDDDVGSEAKAPVSSGSAGARRRAAKGLSQRDDALHDCPLCRSAHPSRLALLRHFAAAHQRPMLTATATDARTHIMWTRGRAVGLPVVVAPDDPRIGGAEAEGGASPAAQPITEVVMVNPEEFAYARELLMRGRHLDDLLASAPVVVHTVDSVGTGAAAAAAAAAGADVNADGRTPTGASRSGSQEPGRAGCRAGGGMDGVGASGAGTAGGGRALSARGLHLHMVPAGQPAEGAAEALRRVAGALALEQVLAAAKQLRGRGGGRATGRAAQQGRGRKGGRSGRAEGEHDKGSDAAMACLCLVSDAEGLDQTLAELREHDVLAMAVTRVTRVPSADVSLRWWAVQGGEYRLSAARQR